MPDPTPEHLASLARVLDPANIKSRGYLAITPHEAAKALYAAVRTDPEVKDAMLAALAAGGRLVEERRQPCSCGSESVGPLRIGHLLADAHTSLRERARYVTHWREVPNA